MNNRDQPAKMDLYLRKAYGNLPIVKGKFRLNRRKAADVPFNKGFHSFRLVLSIFGVSQTLDETRRR
jgi:hypothetical protein